mmetsp:Transcript_46650/g.117314  ORF Transcript_46650/g.117314 Transcript_46650/m.117314 type:complete len:274 (+) Transcript_46650:1077-1898(+)
MRVELSEVLVGHDDAPANAVQGLCKAHEARAFDAIPRVGLDAADLQHLVGGAVPERLAAGGHLDGVGNEFAAAMTLDGIDVVRHDAGLAACLMEDRLLRGAAGSGHARALAAVHRGTAADDADQRQIILDHLAIYHGLGLGPDDGRAGRLAPHIAISRVIKRLTPPGRAEKAGCAVRRPPSFGEDQMHADAASQFLNVAHALLLDGFRSPEYRREPGSGLGVDSQARALATQTEAQPTGTNTRGSTRSSEDADVSASFCVVPLARGHAHIHAA